MDPTQWWGHGFGFMWLIPLLFFVVLLDLCGACLVGVHPVVAPTAIMQHT